MNKHLANLKYLARHKKFVLMAGVAIGAPIVQLLVHDWTKLKPTEWNGYADFFYGGGERSKSTAAEQRATVAEEVKAAFDVAWLYHQNANPHHWQFWHLERDDGSDDYLKMPERYVLEMVADWRGAGAAVGKPDTQAWYNRNRDVIKLHPETRARVEELLGLRAVPLCSGCSMHKDFCICHTLYPQVADRPA